MATHETLAESLEFAFVSKDGQFVGNRDAVLAYNASHPVTPADPFADWGLPWRYDMHTGALATKHLAFVNGEPYRTLCRAIGALDEDQQRKLLALGGMKAGLPE